jgi:hypothetical protein
MRVRLLRAGLWWLAVAACSGGAQQRHPRDERARDSVIGASQLPGAQGVRGALRTADSATARRAREDSIAREPEP